MSVKITTLPYWKKSNYTKKYNRKFKLPPINLILKEIPNQLIIRNQNHKKCCYVLTFWPCQKCHSKVMHRKEVTHSNGSYERKLRGRKLADEMGRVKKFPWYTHRLMHRKRVTSEQHDSYFRLMTIKHSISKIEWALNYYIAQSRRKSRASSSPSESWRRSWTRCGRESHTRVKEPSGSLMNWGPEKMLRRCSKESHHPGEWAPGPPVEQPWRTRKT